MRRRLFAGIALTFAITGASIQDPTPTEARRPIHWKIGEYQQANFDAIPGDTITVFYATRNTEANLEKCMNSGGEGLILVRWRGKLWEACPRVDF